MRSLARQPAPAHRSANPGGIVTGDLPPGLGQQAQAIRRLQSTLGNRALQRLLHNTGGETGAVQAKLQVTAPGDTHEREADRAADEVTGAAGGAARPVSLSPIGPAAAPGATDRSADAGGGSGQALTAADRAYFEPRLGHDLADVRVHADAQAAQMTRDLGARAFTHGRDLYFGAGEYESRTEDGRHLLAHELAHVVQQDGRAGVIQRAPPTAAQKAAAKLAKLKAALISTYGLAGVTNGSGTWTPDELQQVTDAFKLLPKRDKAALKGVTLTRVTSLGAKTAGRFGTNQSVSGTTVVNEATLELADLSFKDGAPASYGVIVHEVAHAVASLPLRTAVHAEHQATAEFNRLVDISNAASSDLNDAVDKQNALLDPLKDAQNDLNAALKSKDKARIATARAAFNKLKQDFTTKKAEADRLRRIWKKADAKTTKAEKIAKTKEESAQKLRISADDLKAIKKDSETAASSHKTSAEDGKKKIDKLTATDKSESAAYVAAVNAAGKAIEDFAKETKDQTKSDAEVDSLVEAVQKKVDERNKKRTDLTKKNKDNAALTALAPVEQSQDTLFDAAKAHSLAHDRTARVQAFVAFVESKGIAPITSYAAENWPHDPEEFFAEAYSMYFTKPNDLKKASQALYDWFKKNKY